MRSIEDKPNPLISVITINKNNLNGLVSSIESVCSQSFTDFEYIIVDGSSTDGSIEHINKIKKKVKLLHCDDRGTGIYSAMNVGIRASSGKYIIFINSGDNLYTPFSLEALAKHASGPDVIYGNIITSDKRNKAELRKPARQIHFQCKYQHNLPYLPACLIKKSALIENQGFREDLRICSDVDMIYKISLSNKEFKYIDTTVTLFDKHGISSVSPLNVLTERFLILISLKKRYVLPLVRVYIRLFIKNMAKLYQRS